MTPTVEEIVKGRPRRTIESLSRLERAWLKRRSCSFCEANMMGKLCYAYSGSYTLPIIEGVRDEEEVVDLGPPCDMDERRAAALQNYKPRAVRTYLESMGDGNG